MSRAHLLFVIPVDAGIQINGRSGTPALAGVTVF